MTRRRSLLLMAITMASCGSPQENEVQETPLQADLRDAIESCRGAQDRALQSPSSDRHVLLAEGCAGLFTLPVCSEAIRLSSAASPELRPMMIVVACHRAYCPLFEEDGEAAPELCAMQPAVSPVADLLRPWSAFASAVLSRELLLEQNTAELTLLVTAVTTLASTPQTELLRPGRALVVEIGRVGPEYRVSAGIYEGESFGPWTLPLAPDAGDFSGLLEASVRAVDGGTVLVQSAADVEQPVVTSLIDALRELGVGDVSVEVAPVE